MNDSVNILTEVFFNFYIVLDGFTFCFGIYPEHVVATLLNTLQNQ